jgi:FAR1 DNA-binding domain
MEFNSLGEAQKFYKSYGSRLEFSVQINTHSKSKNGISSLRMVCSKQGLSKRQCQEEVADGNLDTPQKKTASRRSMCGAYIRFRLLKIGVWAVSAINLEHNYDLITSPAKKRNLRSLKGMSLESTVTPLYHSVREGRKDLRDLSL